MREIALGVQLSIIVTLFSAFTLNAEDGKTPRSEVWNVEAMTTSGQKMNRDWFKNHRATFVHFISASTKYSDEAFNKFLKATKAISPTLLADMPAVVVIDAEGYSKSQVETKIEADPFSHYKLGAYLFVQLTRDDNPIFAGLFDKKLTREQVLKVLSSDELKKRIHFIIDGSGDLTETLNGNEAAPLLHLLRVVNRKGEFIGS